MVVNDIIRFEAFMIDFVAENLVVDKFIKCQIDFKKQGIVPVKTKGCPKKKGCIYVFLTVESK